jgi:hypothetical protein
VRSTSPQVLAIIDHTRCATMVHRRLWTLGRLEDLAEVMDRERTAQHWLIKATPTLRCVSGAERRFSASLKVSEVTVLAASDELGAAARDATAWIATNACPDLELGSRVATMLKTCAEVALTAQQAITHPSGDIKAVFDRLSNLLAIIEMHSHALDNW